MKPKAVIFDIDGCLANTDHRQALAQHKDWKGFFTAMTNDGLHQHVANVLKMYHKFDYAVLLVTGRPAEYQPHTISWLQKHNIYKYMYSLHMRKEGDYRGDDIIKEEIFLSNIEPNFDVEVVYDDRQKVVDMWRRLGLKCFQVAPGDF